LPSRRSSDLAGDYENVPLAGIPDGLLEDGAIPRGSTELFLENRLRVQPFKFSDLPSQVLSHRRYARVPDDCAVFAAQVSQMVRERHFRLISHIFDLNRHLSPAGAGCIV